MLKLWSSGNFWCPLETVSSRILSRVDVPTPAGSIEQSQEHTMYLLRVTTVSRICCGVYQVPVELNSPTVMVLSGRSCIISSSKITYYTRHVIYSVAGIPWPALQSRFVSRSPHVPHQPRNVYWRAGKLTKFQLRATCIEAAVAAIAADHMVCQQTAGMRWWAWWTVTGKRVFQVWCERVDVATGIALER